MSLGRLSASPALAMIIVCAGYGVGSAAASNVRSALDAASTPSVLTGETCPETCETPPPACPIVCAFTWPHDIFPDQCSDAVAADLNARIQCLGFFVGPSASFDRSLGWIEVQASQHPECFGVSSDLIAADRFWIVGPPRVQPVSFTARLTVSSGGDLPRGALRAGAGPVDFQLATSPLEVALQHFAGVEPPFILRYGVRVFENATATGELTFDLPAGYSIASCAGYGAPVATTPASWSTVKQIYRD